MKILLDTSFLISCVKHKIDFFLELERIFPEKHELIILTCIEGELENLSSKNRDAKLALKLVRFKKVKVVKGNSKPCDQSILDYAKAKKAVICTLDREIREKAKEAGLQVIGIKQESHLG